MQIKKDKYSKNMKKNYSLEFNKNIIFEIISKTNVK